MKVKIIGYTKPQDSGLDSSDLVAFCARVSNPGNQMNTETSSKLLKYLVKNKHWSPFEMVNVVMEIETTRDISRQILRHRSFSFQEFSQRYAETETFTYRNPRWQDKKNRQNSTEFDIMSSHDNEVWDEWSKCQRQIMDLVGESYKWALEKGIAKEQARAILPEGLSMTKLYMNGTLRSWIHYCQLRMDPSTQKEHREIAIACWEELCKIYPFLKEVFT